jgi:uncharacterized protein (TIGR03067 family)
VVVANQTDAVMPFSMPTGDSQPARYELKPGDVVAVPTVGGPVIEFHDGREAKRYRLDPNRAFQFDLATDGQMLLKQLDLAGDHASAKGTRIVTDRPATETLTLPVRIFTDDDEIAVQSSWEKRLRRRVAEASQILEKECRIRLQVVDVGRWNSSNRTRDFDASWDEFRDEVKLEPDQLALGFTSQYDAGGAADDPPEAGVRRGLLRRHILIREGGSQFSEAEKLELLVHALGHYLGGFDTDAPDSVMRPLAGDGKARRASFRIGFDPANSLAVNLVAEELRVRKVADPADFTSGTRLRLRQIYSKIPRPVEPAPEPLASTDPVDDPAFDPDEPDRELRRGGGRPPEGLRPDPAAGRIADPRKVTDDRQQLQGTWEVASAKLSGRNSQKITGNEATFEGDALTIKVPRFGKLRFRYELQPGAASKQIVVTHLSQPGKAPGGLDQLHRFSQALSQQSSYTLEGDTLRTSFVVRGFPLPPDLQKQLGDGRVEIVLKRAKDKEK